MEGSGGEHTGTAGLVGRTVSEADAALGGDLGVGDGAEDGGRENEGVEELDHYLIVIGGIVFGGVVYRIV